MKITKITTYRLPPRWMFLKIETDEGVESFIDEINDGTSRDYFSAVLDSFPQVLRDRFDDIAQKRISNALNNLNEAMSSPLAKGGA